LNWSFVDDLLCIRNFGGVTLRLCLDVARVLLRLPSLDLHNRRRSNRLRILELLAEILLDQGGVLENSAWGLGLAVPFALSLIPIRLAFDKIVPANAKLLPPADYAGGLCAAACPA
jgi:hypothetical protein